MLLWIKSLHNLIALLLSLVAMCFTIGFVNDVDSMNIQSSPKALVNLTEIYNPPLIGLQVFIFVFDALICLYYAY